MAEYKFDSSVDKNKIFLVDYTSLLERYDSDFYAEGFCFENSVKLKNFAKAKGGKRLPSGASYENQETSFIYLRVSDLKDGYIDWTKVKYISEEVFTFLSRYEVKEGDLIFSIAGTVGKVVSLTNIPKDKKIILTENASRIEIRKELCSETFPRFLDIVLNTSKLQKQIDLNYVKTTIPKIGLDRVDNLYIPNVPSLEIQNQIVEKYEQAYQQKQQKEQKAKELLASIDSYLLDKLGIQLPERDNSLKARIFTTNFSEVGGSRFDVQDIKNKDLKIEGGTFNNVYLKDLCNIKKGQSITSSNIEDGEYPVIAGGKTSPYNHKYFNYNQEVMTVSASGAYAGYIWYHDSPIFASDCSVLWSKDEQIISNKYLFEILKLKQEDIYNLQQGAGQPHVYASDLMKVKIPLPPLTSAQAKAGEISQQEIVEHISAIRAEAKQLQQEAITDLETVKAEIEKMILG